MKKSFLFLLLIILVSFRSWAQCTPASGFANCVIVTKTTDDGSAGTLRWAITQANANAGGTHIKFNINQTGIISIKLTSLLPTIVQKVFIDGTSNPTYNATTKDQVISVESTNPLNKLDYALKLSKAATSGSKVHSILIKSFSLWGIRVTSEGETNATISSLEIINNAFVNVGNLISGTGMCISMQQEMPNLINNVDIYQNVFNGYRVNGLPIEQIIDPIAMSIGIFFKNVSNVNIGDNTLLNANYGFRMYWFVLSNYGSSTDIEDFIKLNVNFFTSYSLQYVLTSIATYDIYSNEQKSAPQAILNYNNMTITGTAAPNDIVRFYMAAIVNDSYYDANLYLGSVTADASGNFTFLKSQWSDPNVSLFSKRIFLNATSTTGRSSDFFSLPVGSCPEITFTNLPYIVCKSSPIISLVGTPSGGTFTVNGSSTTVLNPSTLNVGSNQIMYSFNSGTWNQSYPGCPNSSDKNVQVPPDPIILKNVIDISAATYNDAWPRDAQVPSSVSYGADGTKFMWAPEEQYAYVDDRNQTNTLTSRTDGLLQNVPWFNWNTTSNGTCYAAWRKVSTNTQIHYGVGMVEAQDILGNYSAVLSGYNNQLNIAAGANAEFHELGFESFEEYIPSQTLNLSNQSNGNITILNAYNSTTDRNKQYGFDYDVIEASGNMLTVNFPQNLLSTLPNKVVAVFGSGVLTNTNKEIHGNYTIESAVAIAGSSDVKIVLKATEFTYSGVWSGKISIPLDLSKDFVPVVTAGVGTQVVNSSVWGTSLTRKAHSGTNFLQVNTNTEIEQIRLQLKPSQQYVVSAWISTNDPNASSYYDANRAVAIDFIDINGAKIAGSGVVFTVSTTPGNIIEGWQKIEGTFTMPANAVRFTVKLLTPLNTVTYFDDLRIHPADGNMVSYVYNITDYKLSATLDQNNYATYYYYDESGSLYLVKKETERGIMTIQESYGHTTEINK